MRLLHEAARMQLRVSVKGHTKLTFFSSAHFKHFGLAGIVILSQKAAGEAEANDIEVSRSMVKHNTNET